MSALPGKGASYWIESTDEPQFGPLADGGEYDVAVVGAGIAGLTTAFLLARAGKRVAVLESKRVLHGVTGYTTAKLTSGHNVVYAHLARHFGEEGARLYAQANEAAIAQVARVVEEEGVDCELERTENYVYSESAGEVETLREEAEAARRAGLPASFVTETELPFPVAGAVRLEDQAQFHPRKYLLHLARAVAAGEGDVFEETRVTGVSDGQPCEVRTERGTVRARDVVVATHLPILDRGLFFAKTHPKRSYVVAAPIDEASAPRGMYITSDSPSRSVRTTPYEGRRLLLVGGEGHKTGQAPDTDERYRRLEAWARERFGADTFAYRWSTQDNQSVDRVPYVGRVRRGSGHVLTATGFGGWGMTGGTVAAMILSDLILGRPNPWAALYDAKRLKPVASAVEFTKENANVAKRWFGDRVAARREQELDGVPPGGGIVTRRGGETLAVHRTEAGSLHAVSAVCTHLACLVSWNPAERSWDCPCHGSRFTREGKVIQGPAVKDLEPRRIEPA